jgi:hypothetical protein
MGFLRLRISVSAGIAFLTLLAPLWAETARTTSRLNLRQEPSTVGTLIELLPVGQELEVIGRRGLWLRVRAGGSEGWVHSDYVVSSSVSPDVRIRQLEKELATLRRSSAARIEELAAQLAEREIQIAELVDAIVDLGGSRPSWDTEPPSRSQPVVAWQVAPAEGLGGDPRPSPDVGDQPPAPTPSGTETGLVEVAVPLALSLPTKHSDADVELEAIGAVRRWAAAWSRQDVVGYLAAYDPQFTPENGVDHGSWAAQQRMLVSSPSSIEVEVSEFDVRIVASDRVAVEFEQAYRSNSFSDRVRKTLDLAWRDGSWKIVREAWN